jgi:hypothetical protein
MAVRSRRPLHVACFALGILLMAGGFVVLARIPPTDPVLHSMLRESDDPIAVRSLAAVRESPEWDSADANRLSQGMGGDRIDEASVLALVILFGLGLALPLLGLLSRTRLRPAPPPPWCEAPRLEREDGCPVAGIPETRGDSDRSRTSPPPSER